MSGGTAGVRGTGAECRKFAPNIFNKSKCSSCFKQKEEHSAEALECNRVSFAWWTFYLFPFLSLSSFLRASVYLARSRIRCLSLSLYPTLSLVYPLFLTYGCVVSPSRSVSRVRTRFVASRYFLFLARPRIPCRDRDQAGWRSWRSGRRCYVRWACTVNAISPRNDQRFSTPDTPCSFSFQAFVALI